MVDHVIDKPFSQPSSESLLGSCVPETAPGYVCRMTVRVVFFLASVLLWDAMTVSAADSVDRMRAERLDIHVGQLLVASPHLRNPNFGKAVVFICRHDDRGTIGLMINRPSSVPIARVFPDIGALQGTSQRLYVGGPVRKQGILMLVKARRAPANMRMIVEGVYAGGDKQVVRKMMGNGEAPERLRVYAGHASWAPGQLAWELSRGIWKQTDGNVANVFDPYPHTLWESLVRSVASPQHTIGHR